jgi:DNA repair exonuclease SbcCD ATPase subunit
MSKPESLLRAVEELELDRDNLKRYYERTFPKVISLTEKNELLRTEITRAKMACQHCGEPPGAHKNNCAVGQLFEENQLLSADNKRLVKEDRRLTEDNKRRMQDRSDLIDQIDDMRDQLSSLRSELDAKDIDDSHVDWKQKLYDERDRHATTTRAYDEMRRSRDDIYEGNGRLLREIDELKKWGRLRPRIEMEEKISDLTALIGEAFTEMATVATADFYMMRFFRVMQKLERTIQKEK